MYNPPCLCLSIHPLIHHSSISMNPLHCQPSLCPFIHPTTYHINPYPFHCLSIYPSIHSIPLSIYSSHNLPYQSIPIPLSIHSSIHTFIIPSLCPIHIYPHQSTPIHPSIHSHTPINPPSIYTSSIHPSILIHPFIYLITAFLYLVLRKFSQYLHCYANSTNPP